MRGDGPEIRGPTGARPQLTAAELKTALAHAGLSFKDVVDVYPLAPLQHGILFHTLSGQEAAVYVATQCWRIGGVLNLQAFERSWRTLFQRHPILRTAFVGQDLEAPLQVVLRQVEVPLRFYDWRNLSAEQQARRITQVLESESSKPFDVGKPPLVRLCLIRTEEREHRLLWTTHHLLLDGWSQPILLEELVAAYSAYSRSESPSLASAPPYRDYISWLQRQDVARAERYWRESLSGFGAPTVLSMSKASGVGDEGAQHATHEHVFDLDVVSLRSFARAHHLTLNTLLLGAWGVVLSRYAGTQDVAFGVTTAGRPVDLPGAELIVGPLINTLPLRVQVNPCESIELLLRQVQARQAQLLEYQYSSLVDVRRWSGLQVGSALFESTFVLERYPSEVVEALSAGSLRFEKLGSTESIHTPLALNFGASSALALRVTFERARFEARMIERLVKHLQIVLRHIASDTECNIRDIPPTE